jgi:hypothetical protein
VEQGAVVQVEAEELSLDGGAIGEEGVGILRLEP